MPTELGAFTPIAGLDGFFSATNGGLRCTAIRLKTGDLCLYSPVAGLGATSRASLDEIGKVAFLLAPNHYHNKALVAYAQAFPDAALLAPAFCHSRLEKITGLRFGNANTLASHLPKDCRIVTPEGLKTGEVWIIHPSAWLVVDAFAGPAKGDGPVQLLKTFPRYGVGDVAVYTAWVGDILANNPPDILVPCHGNILRDPAMRDELINVIRKIG